jgi:hypothetical protein
MTAIALSVAAVICALIARDVVLRVVAGKREIDAVRAEATEHAADARVGRENMRGSIESIGERVDLFEKRIARAEGTALALEDLNTERMVEIAEAKRDIEQLKTAVRLRP